MKLDPLSLQLFVSVIEEGTVAAAAVRHHIAAAAVSKRISELEFQLSTQLLTRSNKGIAPTAAGFALINMARGVLYGLDNIVLQMQDFAAGTRGSVRVLANISVMTQFLPRALKSFVDKYPLVQVNLEEKVSSAIIRAVAENVADVGLYTKVPHGDEVEVYPYRTDELVLIVPKGHALAHRSVVCFADTLDFEFVGLHVGSSLHYQMAEAASKLERTLKLRIQVLSYDAQCLMVEAGLGIGILPKASLRTYNGLSVHEVVLEDAWAHRQLNMCVRSYEALPAAAKLFFDHLQSVK
jgi:DNA-binding transcriptional LysR family regulator